MARGGGKRRAPRGVLTPDEVLSYGLEFAGFGTERQNVQPKTNLERFEAHYGSNPLALAIIWEDLHTVPNRKLRISDQAAQRFDMFLLAHHFLYMYSSEQTLCRIVRRKLGARAPVHFVIAKC